MEAGITPCILLCDFVLPDIGRCSKYIGTSEFVNVGKPVILPPFSLHVN